MEGGTLKYRSIFFNSVLQETPTTWKGGGKFAFFLFMTSVISRLPAPAGEGVGIIFCACIVKPPTSSGLSLQLEPTLCIYLPVDTNKRNRPPFFGVARGADRLYTAISGRAHLSEPNIVRKHAEQMRYSGPFWVLITTLPPPPRDISAAQRRQQ